MSGTGTGEGKAGGRVGNGACLAAWPLADCRSSSLTCTPQPDRERFSLDTRSRRGDKGLQQLSNHRGVTMSTAPTLQSLWLVDEADPGEAGKINITGMFDRIEVNPGNDFTEGAYVFFGLRGVRGEMTLHLTYSSLADNDVLLRLPIVVQGDPLHTVVRAVSTGTIPVPESGSYAWDLFWGNELLGSCRVEATIRGQ